MTRPWGPLSVREASAADAARIAELSEELGHPIGVETARERIVLLRGAEHEIAVAVRPPVGVVGWTEVRVEEGLTSGRRCRVLGLVVDGRLRRTGTGRALLAWSEAWARARGCAELYLLSDVVREESHAFYVASGWSWRRSAHVYVRETGRAGGGRV